MLAINKSHFYFLLAGFVLATILFVFLTFRGCFDRATKSDKPNLPVAVIDTPKPVTVAGKPLSEQSQKRLIEYRDTGRIVTKSDTVKEIIYNGGECPSYELDATLPQNITVKQGGKSYYFANQLFLKGISDCSFGDMIDLSATSSQSELEIPEHEPISVYKHPVLQVKAFAGMDLLHTRDWRIGVKGELTIDRTSVESAPNINPNHIFSIPTDVNYNLFEK